MSRWSLTGISPVWTARSTSPTEPRKWSACPATPAGLDVIKRPERLADGPEIDAFVDAISRRERWAFRRVNTADTTGKERYECPARAGKVRCPLITASMTRPLALPTVIGPPAVNPPTCCTQRTITMPGDVDAKSRQRHYWGSRDWIAAFSRRSRVEGWFGNLKGNNTEGLTRGGFRVMGIAKTSLMLGIYAAATNLRLLRLWTARRQTPSEVTGSVSAASNRGRTRTQPSVTSRRRRPPD